jgi:hypothetical protein
MRLLNSRVIDEVKDSSGDCWYRAYDYEFICDNCSQIGWGFETLDLRTPIYDPKEEIK